MRPKFAFDWSREVGGIKWRHCSLLPFQQLPDFLCELGDHLILTSLDPQQLVWYGPKMVNLLNENVKFHPSTHIAL
jgi:hypothetical protein